MTPFRCIRVVMSDAMRGRRAREADVNWPGFWLRRRVGWLACATGHACGVRACEAQLWHLARDAGWSCVSGEPGGWHGEHARRAFCDEQ